jgi:hypothetical protein
VPAGPSAQKRRSGPQFAAGRRHGPSSNHPDHLLPARWPTNLDRTPRNSTYGLNVRTAGSRLACETDALRPPGASSAERTSYPTTRSLELLITGCWALATNVSRSRPRRASPFTSSGQARARQTRRRPRRPRRPRRRKGFGRSSCSTRRSRSCRCAPDACNETSRPARAALESTKALQIRAFALDVVHRCAGGAELLLGH